MQIQQDSACRGENLLSKIYENRQITEKIVEKSPGQLFYCFVPSQRSQNRTLFYATLSFENQDLTSISEKVSSACTVLLNLHFYTSYSSGVLPLTQRGAGWASPQVGAVRAAGQR